MVEPGVVIFTEGPPSDWRRAALSLANACPGLTYADAARACRFSQGFLDLVLAPAQLEAAAAALTHAGSPASVLRTADRVVVPPAFTLLRIGIDDLGLSCLEPKGPRVPWRRVKLLHLARVGPSALRARGLSAPDLVDPRLLGAVRSRLEAEPEPAAPSAPAELWLELVLAEPLARLRIRASSFIYDCIPERAQADSEQNLRRVIELVADHAPKAISAGPIDGAEPIDDHGNDRAVSWELTRLKLMNGTEFAPAAPVVESEPSAELEPDPLEGTIGLLSRFRRGALLSASIVLAVIARMVLLRNYPQLPGRMIWPVQLALWVPIVLVLSVLYVGVQMRLDTIKERRRNRP